MAAEDRSTEVVTPQASRKPSDLPAPWFMGKAADALCCPRCLSSLRRGPATLECRNSACAQDYPIVGGIPVLIDDGTSLFKLSDFTAGKPTTYAHVRNTGALNDWLRSHLPSLGTSEPSVAQVARFAHSVRQVASRPRVLVIGGRTLGAGMEALIAPDIDLIESDVSMDGRTNLVCDAHQLPFVAGSIDGVVAQAVLEHVLDPYRCVAEMHRVLRTNGLVYAETPFIQQVHGGRYDFTRFTPLGHRRLFRQFDELAAGPVGGPAIALAWSILYFYRGFAETRRGAQIATVAAALTASWLKHLDRRMIGRRGAADGAWGSYFLGQRTDDVLSDAALVSTYTPLTE